MIGSQLKAIQQEKAKLESEMQKLKTDMTAREQAQKTQKDQLET